EVTDRSSRSVRQKAWKHRIEKAFGQITVDRRAARSLITDDRKGAVRFTQERFSPVYGHGTGVSHSGGLGRFVVEDSACAVHAEHERVFMPRNGNRTEISRAEAGSAPSGPPAVIAVKEKRTPIVEGGEDVRCVSAPRKGGLSQIPRNRDAVVPSRR